MSNLTHSATQTVTTVLGTITTAANTIDRSLSTLDCATQVMQNKAQHWAQVTNAITALRAKGSVILATTEVHQEIASRLKAHAKFASEDDNQQWLAQAQALLAT